MILTYKYGRFTERVFQAMQIVIVWFLKNALFFKECLSSSVEYQFENHWFQAPNDYSFCLIHRSL